jgi:hypothetical protein
VPIIDIQRRYRELGRLRLGTRRGASGPPVRLSTWRLTSPDRSLLDAAAELWGGEVGVWENAPTEGDQYELTTEVSDLNVYVPPQDVDAGQFFELWSRGGVQRRCDGVTEFVSGRGCQCDPDPERRECSITTHLMVLLPQLPDVGVWRVRTTSWNAATELPPTVELLRRIHEAGAYPLGVLGIESRTSITGGQTRHYSLPVLRFPSSIAATERAGIPVLSGRGERPPLPAERPALPDDARFSHDRVGWGTPPAIPETPVVIEPADPAIPEGPPPGAEPVGEVTPEGFGEGPEGHTSPAGGTAWERYVAAVEAVGGATEARRLLMETAKAERWGWPPKDAWPSDRLDTLANTLFDAAEASPMEAS